MTGAPTSKVALITGGSSKHDQSATLDREAAG